MALTNDERMMTGRCMDGTWEYHDADIHIRVFIQKNDVFNLRIQRTNQDLFEISMSSSAHWFGDYLCFITNNSPYYVRYANENSLIFGELENGGIIGVRKWEYDFKRVIC